MSHTIKLDELKRRNPYALEARFLPVVKMRDRRNRREKSRVLAELRRELAEARS